MHEVLPEKAYKASVKDYLAQYKQSTGLKRFTKKKKEEALSYYTVTVDSFKPKDDKYHEKVFDEMYNLVYLLRTEEEIAKYWKEFKFVEPLKEKFMDWDEIDEKMALLYADPIEEDFEDDITFMDENDDDLELDLNDL